VLRKLEDLLASLENQGQPINIKTKQMARLAIGGHDMIRHGQTPAEDSAEVMRDTLRGLLDEEDTEVIARAIVQHNKSPEDRDEQPSMVAKLLIDADKLDWTRKRYGLADGEEDEPLETQFGDETAMILDGVYFDLTRNHLQGLLEPY
jgi:hypothetical protein